MTYRRALTVTIWIGLASMACACRGRDEAPAHDQPAPSPSAATPRPNGRPDPVTSDTAPATTPDTANGTAPVPALEMIPTGPVSLWKGPGGQSFEVTLRTADPASALARRFGTVTMRTSLRARSPDLGQYPCTSCHLGRRMVLADERVADAHQNIRAVHPVQTGGVCSTCHLSDDVELLTLKSGERATLDHAYRLCAQCHFSQAEAWAGGAHGKRLDGWQGRRVLMGCADCHDPHKPALEPRIPFRAPRIGRPRGDGQ